MSVLAAQNNESPEALLDALLPDAEKIEEKDDGKISASDFGRFVTECLPRSPFTAAALLTAALVLVLYDEAKKYV